MITLLHIRIMHIQFCGAARTTTGSQHLLHIGGKKILLDCGLFQGHRKEAEERNTTFHFDPAELDYMILSHAHIDHCGLLPLLVKKGYTGSIYTTAATRDLVSVMLMDSAYIQEKDAEYINLKLQKKGLPHVEPLYTVDDVPPVLANIETVGYNRCHPLDDDISICFYDAGHVLGSAVIQIHSKSENLTVGFTGDLGRRGLPILRDPVPLPHADVYITEGTYGNRSHADTSHMEDSVAEVFNETIKRGGKIIIPSFALERTQELVYIIHKLLLAGRIPEVPMFVDSPMASNVTQIFKMHPECYDKETYEEFLKDQQNPFGFSSLKYTASVDESKALNTFEGPCVIIAASGMCEAGRIVHHLYNHITDERNTVMIVGYQVEGTLGRKLVDGHAEVSIFGDSLPVRAEVKVLNAFSAHADQNELVEYAKRVPGIKQVFIVHGEDDSLHKLKENLQRELALHPTKVIVPELFRTYEVVL